MFKDKNKAVRIIGYLGLVIALVYFADFIVLPKMLKSGITAPITQVPIVTPQLFSGIVRLYDSTQGTYCTGVVVDSKHIVTAKHCVMDKTGNLYFEVINIRDVDNTVRNVLAKVSASFANRDAAVLTGDFTMFKPIAIATPEEAARMQHTGKTMFACGYAMDLAFICMPVRFVDKPYTYSGMWRVTGTLMPGMSGGPAIIFERGIADCVASINTAYDDVNNYSAITPIYDIITVQ